MGTVAQLIEQNVTLSVECIDRVYLNGYIPRLQLGGELNLFLTRHRGNPIASPALLGQISESFRASVKEFAQAHDIPLIEFKKGQRKDDIVHEYRRRFNKSEGVVVIGVAQEKAHAFKATKTTKEGRLAFEWSRRSVAVNHYYFYVEDREFGPAFLKICSYGPYGMRLCLNGHEWVKRQLMKEGIAFEALDNGFLSCENPRRLQAVCEALGPQDFQAFLDLWLPRLPFPLTAEDRAAGYTPQLAIWQMEVSLTQVFERPLQGRRFFEQIIRDNLDLGRPDHVQIVFGRQVRKNTPGRFKTRVLQHGVLPSLHISYKHSQVKQYVKENRALRTETTINDPADFGVNKGLRKFNYLRQIGQNINRRLLDAQTTSLQGMSQFELDAIVRPTVRDDGQRAPGLRFGDPRTRALFQSLVLLMHVIDGFTNQTLRQHVATFLGPDVPYTASQMTYDLRRLRLKGFIYRRRGTRRYWLTSHERKVALFFAKLDMRLFAQAGAEITASCRPPTEPETLSRALRQVDLALDAMIDDAGLRAA